MRLTALLTVGLAGGLAITEAVNASGGTRAAAGPVVFTPAGPLNAARPYSLAVEAGRSIPAQVDHEGRVWSWWDSIPADGDLAASLGPLPAEAAGRPAVEVQELHTGVISVSIDGRPFTALNFKPDDPKPYLYPVIGPTGAPVTRDFPMKENEEEKRHRRLDHPHQRSIWTAFGDVRTGNFSQKGTDYWAEGSGRGVLRVARIVRTVSGPVFGQIEAEVDWLTADGRRELSDTRTYTFFRGDDDTRIIDFRLVLHFPEQDVMFYDTKEAGFISVRLATSMDGVSGGTMTNSKGQTGEGECWGQPARWCDYFGQVDGQTVGIAIFDHPQNWRHPARWHIRNYGLFTVNPVGRQTFDKELDDGSHVWKKGDQAEFNYRMVIHKGDTQAAGIARQYRLYAEPPAVTVAER